ncbi:hypothetical protein EYF80_000404 [Liparis tanakae]|uniref:Uncharacterized protein n=1 Tax=Liparis tanakae TaxID=230148 RepID=A0A4Z2JFT6_9TELE|nr:hypothetical protein EYF80_000404 [Liparis tanakae]
MLLDVGQLSRYGCSSGKSGDGREGDKVAAKFGSSPGFTQRQLGAAASSVMPVATSGPGGGGIIIPNNN